MPAAPASPAAVPAAMLAKSWVKAEVGFPGNVGPGAPKANVKRVQEWVSLHGFVTSIDGDYGPGTQRAVAAFQKKKLPGSAGSGIVGAKTWQALVAPMVKALSHAPADAVTTYERVVEQVALAHLASHPREVGGQNMGPWVRLYTQGREGAAWPWCAGYVSFMLMQASVLTGTKSPYAYTLSCDVLAMEAKKKKLFRTSANVMEGGEPETGIFLVRRTPSDWTHTGIATDFREKTTETLEGNSNDSGSREGHEVCKRFRALGTKLDFARLS